LACGTGAVAAALIANRVRDALSPVKVRVRSGEYLSVSFKKMDDRLYQDVSLSGSAHVAFSGTFKYDFSTHSIIDIF
jgi:Diaminopimelate epimerase